jgi:hypothetical protein
MAGAERPSGDPAPWKSRSCDGSATNGCEAHVTADPFNCGSCGVACPAAQACVNGQCACPVSGQTLCGGACVDLQSDPANCGGCTITCPSGANTSAACIGGVCGQATCTAGFGNCDGNPSNGCETSTTSDLNNCGACGNVCPAVAHGFGACTASVCSVGACDPGFANCNNNPADGCETSLASDASNCGFCGNACGFNNATGACLASNCVLAACNTGFADCDGNPANGCERNVQADALNCGACGHVCLPSQVCASGVCQ